MRGLWTNRGKYRERILRPLIYNIAGIKIIGKQTKAQGLGIMNELDGIWNYS